MASPLTLDVVNLSLVGSNILQSIVVQKPVPILVFLQEKMRARLSTLPSHLTLSPQLGWAASQPARPPVLLCMPRPLQPRSRGSSETLGPRGNHQRGQEESWELHGEHNQNPRPVSRPRRKCLLPRLPQDSGSQLGISLRFADGQRALR